MEKTIKKEQKDGLFLKSTSAHGEQGSCDAIQQMDERGKIANQLKGSELRSIVHRSVVDDILDVAGAILKKCFRLIINALITPKDLINYHRWRDPDKG